MDSSAATYVGFRRPYTFSSPYDPVSLCAGAEPDARLSIQKLKDAMELQRVARRTSSCLLMVNLRHRHEAF